MAALAGLHVAFSFGGGPGWGRESLPVIGAPELSQTLATAGSTTIAAPTDVVASGDLAGGVRQPICSLISSVAGWVSIRATPDAATNPRRRIKADTDYDFMVAPGVKVDWLPDS
jgi:hypothetical protein